MNRTEAMRVVVEGVLNDLELRPPFRIGEFLDALHGRWCLTSKLVPYSLADEQIGPHVTGWCVLRGDQFEVHYYAGGSAAQQEHIIYHEVGHLVLRHVAPGQPEPRYRCDAQHTDAELNAEVFADLMVELAELGDESHHAVKRSGSGTYNPYVSFLSAQEL